MNALTVFVPRGADENYRHGIANGIWGFKVPGDLAKVHAGDLVIFARWFSGSPRQSLANWRNGTLRTLAVFEAIGEYFKEDRLEWPDEKQEKRTKYPHRIRFRGPVKEMENVRLAALGDALVDAVQRSANANGRANVVAGFDPRVLSLDGVALVEPKVTDAHSTTEPPTNAQVRRVLEHLSTSGFTFSDRMVRSFIAAIRAKPFVILAGNSGTGKSRLVRLVAEACGATPESSGFNLIAVRPDWSDGSELLGYLDLQNSFRPGQLFEPLLRAHSNPKVPVFVCLDEMNLARVEHYFSDFLSKFESRRRAPDGRVISDPVICARDLERLEDASISENLRETFARLKKAGEGIHFPPNLIVVGTVNMDETTHAFSRKVLDRANTLEIEADKLSTNIPAAASGTPVVTTPPPSAIELSAPFLTAQDMVTDPRHAEALDYVAKLLDELNEILAEANLQVAYRVRDEAAAFHFHAMDAGLSKEEADQAIVMQKILPRVQGSSPRLRRVLEKLLRRFHPAVQLEPDGERLSDDLLALRRNAEMSPLVRKLAGMWLAFEEEGYTSFWVA